jgi:hypothetical protein
MQSSILAISIAFGSGGGPGPGGGSTAFNGVTISDPVAGWGFVLRNSDYSGPAVEIEDVDNPGTYSDLSFDVNGKVTAALPYTNNRVSTLYDQWGADDLIWNNVDAGDYMEPFEAGQGDGGVTAATMFMKTTDANEYKTGGLTSTLSAGTAAWAVGYPTLVSSVVRSDNQIRATLMGVRGNTVYHWGHIINHLETFGVNIKDSFIDVNGESYVDYGNSRLYASILDHSTTAIEVNVNDGKFTYSAAATSAYTYNSTRKFHMGWWSTNYGQFSGAYFEAHVFADSTELTPTEVSALTVLLQQCEESFEGFDDGGTNLALAANMTTDISTGTTTNDVFEDRPGYLYISLDTDDGTHENVRYGAQTLTDGNSLEWRFKSGIGTSRNYDHSRVALFRSDGWRIEFGTIFENGWKLGITVYTDTGGFDDNKYVVSTYADNEYFRVYYSATGVLKFDTSADGITWVNVGTETWTISGVGLVASYNTSLNGNKTIWGKLYNLEEVSGGEP